MPKKFQELSPCPFSGLVPVIELRFRIFGRVWPWSLVDLLGKSDEDVPAELFEFFDVAVLESGSTGNAFVFLFWMCLLRGERAQR